MSTKIATLPAWRWYIHRWMPNGGYPRILHLFLSDGAGEYRVIPHEPYGDIASVVLCKTVDDEEAIGSRPVVVRLDDEMLFGTLNAAIDRWLCMMAPTPQAWDRLPKDVRSEISAAMAKADESYV